MGVVDVNICLSSHLKEELDCIHCYVALSDIFLLYRDSFYCDLSSLANWAQLRYVSV